MPKGASMSLPVAAPAQSRLGKLFDKLRHVKGAIVAVAGLGAVLSGLYGYWTIYQGVKVTAPSSIATTATANAGPLSIVVLPFSNQTGDPQKTYIADALTTSITSDLSRIRDAFVIPPTTAFLYKDKPASAQQIGKDVGVRFVLQGSALTNGEKVRISAQLADTQSGAQLWSETFDGELTKLFALHDQVTTRISNSIGREMVILAARESETRKSSPKVADLMMRARALDLKPRSLKNHQQSEALFREVLALDSNNPSAMVGLAVSLVRQTVNFGSGLDESTRERKYAEGHGLALKVRELDPDNPRIYTVLGFYARDHDDFAGCRRAFETQLSLEPKNPDAYSQLALFYIKAVEPKRAIELLAQAIALDPRHPADYILKNMSYAFFMLGDNDAAIEWGQRSLEKNPIWPDTYSYLAMAYAMKGDEAKARAAATEYRRLNPNGKLSKSDRPPSSYPSVSKEWFDNKLFPAWRKAGLPE